MAVYDGLPPYLRDFYKTHQARPDWIKAARIAEHFDEPLEPMLRKHAQEEIEIHEMLFNVTLDTRLNRNRPNDFYYPTLTCPDLPVFWNKGTDKR